MQNKYDNFRASNSHRWRTIAVGSGQVSTGDNGLRCALHNATRHHYSDAQLDDVRGQQRILPWQPPLRLTLRARFSHPADQLHGTAGFGFWNAPLMPGHMPALPRALWFFFMSTPGRMPLAAGVAGHGWKAATIDAQAPAALAWLPLAPLVVPLLNIPALAPPLWRQVQPALRLQEQLLDVAMEQWQIYTIEWQVSRVKFYVNAKLVLHQSPAPQAPLCCVIWMDNQYAIIEPKGRFGWGLLDSAGEQWLEVDWLAIERESSDSNTREAGEDRQV